MAVANKVLAPNWCCLIIRIVAAAYIPPTSWRGFAGYLQVDGYAGYEKTHATLVGCWAHARRKFVEAQKAQGGKGKTGKADVALNHIQKLYALESIKNRAA